MSDVGRGEQIRTADPWPPMPVRYQAAPRPDVSLPSALRECFCCAPPERAREAPVMSKPWGCSGSWSRERHDSTFYTLPTTWSSAETGEPGDFSPVRRAISCRLAGLTMQCLFQPSDRQRRGAFLVGGTNLFFRESFSAFSCEGIRKSELRLSSLRPQPHLHRRTFSAIFIPPFKETLTVILRAVVNPIVPVNSQTGDIPRHDRAVQKTTPRQLTDSPRGSGCVSYRARETDGSATKGA